MSSHPFQLLLVLREGRAIRFSSFCLHGWFSLKVMELLKLFGVPYVVAPMEAEVRIKRFFCHAAHYQPLVGSTLLVSLPPETSSLPRTYPASIKRAPRQPRVYVAACVSAVK